MRKDLFSVVIGMISLVFAGCSQSRQIQVSNLKLEQMVKPLGVNVTQPRFSWQIASSTPDLVQTTYQIQVAADPEELAVGFRCRNFGYFYLGVLRWEGSGARKVLLLAC